VRSITILADAGLLQAGHQVLADLFVLHQFVGVVVTAVPVAVPALDEAEALADRMCFLSHGSFSRLLVGGIDDQAHVVAALLHAVRTALRGGKHALQATRFVHLHGLHHQAGLIGLLAFVLGLPVGDGAQQELLQIGGCCGGC
jgi:hypothetical protein